MALLLSVVSVFVAGCAVQRDPFQRASAPPANAVIYVYRPYHYGSSLLRPAVTFGDGTARIGPGGYHPFIAPAGQKGTRNMPSSETADEVEIHADARRYYGREGVGWGHLTRLPPFNS